MKKYISNNFRQKLERMAHKFGGKIIYCALLLFYMLEDQDVSPKNKVAIIGGLCYFIWPFDFIPDFIPGGYADDLTALMAVISLIKSNISEATHDKTKEKMKELGFRDETIKKNVVHKTRKTAKKELKNA